MPRNADSLLLSSHEINQPFANPVTWIRSARQNASTFNKVACVLTNLLQESLELRSTETTFGIFRNATFVVLYEEVIPTAPMRRFDAESHRGLHRIKCTITASRTPLHDPDIAGPCTSYNLVAEAKCLKRNGKEFWIASGPGDTPCGALCKGKLVVGVRISLDIRVAHVDLGINGTWSPGDLAWNEVLRLLSITSWALFDQHAEVRSGGPYQLQPDLLRNVMAIGGEQIFVARSEWRREENGNSVFIVYG